MQLAAEAGHRVIAQAGRDDERWPHTLGAAEVLPRDMDLGAIDPVPAIFDAVPLGEPVFAAVQDGGAIVSTRRPPEAPPERRIRQESFLVHRDREALRELVDAVAAGAASHAGGPHPAARRGGGGPPPGRGRRAARKSRSDPMS